MNNQRLKFDFSKDAVSRLNEIKKRTHAVTRAEVMTGALKLYDWITWQLERGTIIGIEKKANLFTLKIFNIDIYRLLV